MTANLLELTSLQQAKLIARKEISCHELTRFYLDRIQRLDPLLSAFVDLSPRKALVAALAKDRMVKSGAKLPPFHGVPIGIKDMNLVRGMRTRFGSRATIPFWSLVDDNTVRPLRKAGFVIVGKLSTCELGVLPVTEPDIHPPTRNPWNTAYSSGGSSGGSSAAVASGMLPLAQASDGGGSIRIPACFTGLVGLKPARGRLPHQFGLPDRQVLYTSGMLVRTVEEAAAILDLQSGVSSGKTHWAPAPTESFSALALHEPKGLRIRMTLDSPLVTAHPEVRAAVLKTAKVLKQLGHTIDVTPYPDGSLEEFLPLWQFLAAQLPLMRPDLAQPFTQWLRGPGKKLKQQHVEALHQQFEAKLLAWSTQADLWLTPTVAQLAPKVGEVTQHQPPHALFEQIGRIGAFTAIANITGQPAINIPAGVSALGLPIGVQLMGPPLGEAMLLQVARQLEQAQPWKHLALNS